MIASERQLVHSSSPSPPETEQPAIATDARIPRQRTIEHHSTRGEGGNRKQKSRRHGTTPAYLVEMRGIEPLTS